MTLGSTRICGVANSAKAVTAERALTILPRARARLPQRSSHGQAMCHRPLEESCRLGARSCCGCDFAPGAPALFAVFSAGGLNLGFSGFFIQFSSVDKCYASLLNVAPASLLLGRLPIANESRRGAVKWSRTASGT